MPRRGCREWFISANVRGQRGEVDAVHVVGHHPYGVHLGLEVLSLARVDLGGQWGT